MSNSATLTGERSNSKLAAVFVSEAPARAAARQVCTRLGLPETRVRVLCPGERQLGRKLEPESHGIFRTMLIAHAKLGVLGAVLGVVVFGILMMLRIPWIVSSWPAALALLIAFGAVAGLFWGGLVTLRPDHDPYVLKVQGALEKGRFVVVVHALSGEERSQAEEVLAAGGGDTVQTL